MRTRMWLYVTACAEVCSLLGEPELGLRVPRLDDDQMMPAELVLSERKQDLDQ